MLKFILVAAILIAPFLRADSLQVGKTFPNLTLPPISGAPPESVHQHLGQKTILHLFASW